MVGSHGGKRDGAGRKAIAAEGETVPISVTIPKKLVDAVDQEANRDEISRSQAITDAARQWIAVRKLNRKRKKS